MVGLGLTNVFEGWGVRAMNLRGRSSLRSCELGPVDGIRSVSFDIRAAWTIERRSAVALTGTTGSGWSIEASVNARGAVAAELGSFE